MASENKNSPGTSEKNIDTLTIIASAEKNLPVERKLTPIGSGNNDISVAQWIKDTSNTVRRNPNLSQLESIVKTGKYIEQPRPVHPTKYHGPQPREPIATGDTVIDVRNTLAFHDLNDEWEEQNTKYLAEVRIFNKRNETWYLQEDANKAKLPQIFQLLVDRISGLSQDLIATRKMDWDQLNEHQDPVELRKYIIETHSALSSGVAILDELDTASIVWDVRMKETERVREYYTRFMGIIQAANEMKCPKIRSELECAIFLRSLHARFNSMVRSFKHDAMMAKHPYPTRILDTISILEDYERESSGKASPYIYSAVENRDDVEREREDPIDNKHDKKKILYCFGFNGKGCKKGSKCPYVHAKASEAVLKKQPGWSERTADSATTGSSKEKCEACDGNHDKSKCPIMIAGRKALKTPSPMREDIIDVITEWSVHDDREQILGWAREQLEERQIH
jgi:hypothetical protein